MVWDASYREFPDQPQIPRPYGMLVGVRKLHTGQLGRVHMLHQMEKVWSLELLEITNGGV
jgi:hypothetical protein